MSSAFVVSYVLLWCIVIVQAFVLRAVLADTLRYIGVYFGPRDEHPRLPAGTLAPEVATRLLNTDAIWSTSRLERGETLLLFVKPAESTSSPLYTNLPASIHVLWHQVKGRFYLVCDGDEEACRTFADQQRTAHGNHPLHVLLDYGGRIARAFGVSETPEGVLLDEQHRVKKYGRPEVDEDIV